MPDLPVLRRDLTPSQRLRCPICSAYVNVIRIIDRIDQGWLLNMGHTDWVHSRTVRLMTCGHKWHQWFECDETGQPLPEAAWIAGTSWIDWFEELGLDKESLRALREAFLKEYTDGDPEHHRPPRIA